MGICDTEIYNDGDMTELGDISEPSSILDGKGSTREGKTSPRLGHRRSSRIRKRVGDMSCSSSDESDPNIQMDENALIEDEEKIMIKEESDLDNSQRAENQLLAVALMKSVMEQKAEKNAKSSLVKLEDTSGIGLEENVKKNYEIKKEFTEKTEGMQQAVQLESQLDEGKLILDKGTCAQNNHKFYVKTEMNNGKPPGFAENGASTMAQFGSTPKTESSKSEKIMTNAGKAKSSKVVIAHVSTNNKTTIYRNNRIRTKGSKNGRTMALKGAYASVREAPRIIVQPSVSLPVPNPILTSPALREFKASEAQTLKSKVNLNVLKKEDGIDQTMTNCSQDIFQTHSIHVPTLCMSSNTLGQQQSQNEVGARSRTNSVSFALPDHPGVPSNLNNNFAPRRRIFSIDLDPEGFDFDISIGVTCNDSSTDYVDSVSALPPITSSSSTVDKKDLDSDYSTGNQIDNNGAGLVQDSSMTSTRSRGMSFELFAFAQNEQESSSDPVDMKEEALNGGRPRGDSIIFDPVSFTDGGIHEENALQRLRQNSLILAETDEIELMNTPGFIEGPPPQSISQGHHGQSTSNPASNYTINKTKKGRTNRSTPSNSNGGRYHHVRQSKSSSTNANTSKSKSHIGMTVISGNNIQNTKDTIHMPHGSAAAAAAAASLSSQVIPCSLNGTITACPMELLNKGGRIGIYLPEARRERIAKFHSKRKNRIWRKRIKYDCRKKLADSRPRIKGRFVKSLEE